MRQSHKFPQPQPQRWSLGIQGVGGRQGSHAAGERAAVGWKTGGPHIRGPQTLSESAQRMWGESFRWEKHTPPGILTAATIKPRQDDEDSESWIGEEDQKSKYHRTGGKLTIFPSIRPYPELDAARKLEVASGEQVGRAPGALKDWGKRLLILRKRAKSHHFFFSLLCSLRPQSPSNPLMAAMGAKEAIKSRNQWNGKQKNNGENFKKPKVGSLQISLKLIGF